MTNFEALKHSFNYDYS